MNTLPKGFVDYVNRYPQLEILTEALLTDPEVSVRINPAKPSGGVADMAISEGDRVPWCADGYYLGARPQFTFDPTMHRGAYYVQDASSMAIAAVIKQLCKAPVKYLDACAAPGGKTTCALSALPKGSMVVANEFDYRRADILNENIAKWGLPDVVVTRGSTDKLARLSEYFDVVAVDAPCSGEGMMRKDRQAVDQWSESLVVDCSMLQREILSNAWQCLKPGGYLIYSTCTFNRTENEENLMWLISEYDAEPVKIDALDANEDIIKGIDCEAPCYRFLPGRIRGEGLFICAVRKPGEQRHHQRRRSNVKARPADGVAAWLDCDAMTHTVGQDIYAMSRANADEMVYVASQLDAIACGCNVATLKGRDLIPTHQLALSTMLRPEAFAQCEISTDDAITFLQRGNIMLPDGTPRGFVLLTHDASPIGFVKNIGNRSNNLLPKQWRILSQKN